MSKPIEFKFQETQDLVEHRQYSEQMLKNSIESYERAKGLPPRAWRWPTAAELRAMAAKEPDPMIEITAMRNRLNPNPFRNFRRRLNTPF